MCARQCDDRAVSIFFGAWNLISGPCWFLLSVYFISQRKKSEDGTVVSYEKFWYVFCMIVFVAAIIHTLSGVLLLFGVWKDYGGVFLVGMAISNFLPIVLVLTVIIPIIQVSCVLRAINYWRSNWP
ncbi:uncharacterized protein LOC108157773 [Drosophila miranda]|uniref:uncharacterized protein LOC108157773 n=1 Tax=Drosophila miranda TaxID=7229 RepID=UPI0007E84E99|nr:uncharacterized protein LOC108157773 [Drosophila miranda]